MIQWQFIGSQSKFLVFLILLLINGSVLDMKCLSVKLKKHLIGTDAAGGEGKEFDTYKEDSRIHVESAMC